MKKLDLENKLLNNFISEKQQLLISLLLNNNISKNQITPIFKDLDIDNSHHYFLLMLSYLGLKTNWQNFPKEIIPRLKGIQKYYLTLLTMKNPWFINQIKILNENDIPVLLTKDIAIKAYYAKDITRIIRNFDIIIPKEKYNMAIDLLISQKDNININNQKNHSSIFNEKYDAEINIYNYIFKTNVENTDIWKNSKTIDFFDIKVKILSSYDMLIHILDIQSRNIFLNEGLGARGRWIYDCITIIKKIDNFSIKYLINRSKELHCTNRIRLTLIILNKYFPEIIKEEDIDKYLPLNNEYKKWLKSAFKFLKYYKYYNSTPKGVTLPFRLAKKEFLNYKYLKYEMKLEDPHINFIKFIKETKNINSFSELIKKCRI